MTTDPEVIQRCSDIYEVGTKKALGYLPIDTIKTYGDTPENIREWADSKGYEFRQYTQEECHIGWTGAVYVYDPAMLSEILEFHSEVLASPVIPIPTTPDEYVKHIIAHNYNPEYSDKNPYGVPCHVDVYRVIGLTYNDPRWRIK